MKKVIMATAIAACIALYAAVWPQNNAVEETPAPPPTPGQSAAQTNIEPQTGDMVYVPSFGWIESQEPNQIDYAEDMYENGMDVKTLSATIGHVSAATTLDIYSRMTDTMQMQAAVSIDRKIGKTDARMSVVEQPSEETVKSPVNAPCAPTEPHPGPIPAQDTKIGYRMPLSDQ